MPEAGGQEPGDPNQWGTGHGSLSRRCLLGCNPLGKDTLARNRGQGKEETSGTKQRVQRLEHSRTS